MRNLRHLLRMSNWARHPPSSRRVKLVLGVIAISLVVWGLEQIFGFPEGWPARFPPKWTP